MSIIDISEVKPGSHVTLHYRLALADGADIVNTFTDKPATLLLGAGHLAPPLEEILLGLKVGHHSTFRLMAGQAFGPRNPEMIQRVSLATLRANAMIGEDFSPGDLVEFKRFNPLPEWGKSWLSYRNSMLAHKPIRTGLLDVIEKVGARRGTK